LAKLRWNKGRLFVDLVFRAERCRESLGLPDTPQNRKLGEQLAKKIDAEQALGVFDYARTFPRSKKLSKFGLKVAQRWLTVGESASNWLETRRPSLKPATFYDYANIILTHLLPSKLAEMLIDTVRPSNVRLWIAELDAKRTESGDKRLGPRRMNMARDRLFGIFEAAVEDELIRDNPVRLVKRLSEPVPDINPLTFEEVEKLLGLATGWEHSLFTVLLLGGLRPNEALALRWNDIDFPRNQILVRTSMSRHGRGTPKTRRSVREVEMLPPVRQALDTQRERSQWRHYLVFPNQHGRPLDESNVRDRHWKRLLMRAGLPYRPLNQTRHTYATLELADLENVLFVSRQLGHTNPETTLRRYARFMQRVPRIGRLAERFKAAPRQKRAAQAGPPGARITAKKLDIAGRIGGAGDGDRTRDVQLGKLGR